MPPSLLGLKGGLPVYVPGGGDDLCRLFSEDMQAVSSRWAGVGWTLAVLGTVLTAMGGILGAGPDGAAWYRRSAGVLLASLGSAAAAGSAYAVSRSKAASASAARATLARMLPDDHEKFVACLRARALWLESRVESIDAAPPPKGDAKSVGDQRPPRDASGTPSEPPSE